MKFGEVTTQDKAAILNFNCEHSIIVPYQKTCAIQKLVHSRSRQVVARVVKKCVGIFVEITLITLFCLRLNL